MDIVQKDYDFKAFIGVFDRKSIADRLLCWLTYLVEEAKQTAD